MNPHADVKETVKEGNSVITAAAVHHVQTQLKHAAITDGIRGIPVDVQE